MADDQTKAAPRDAKKISLSEDYEVRYWTHELGVTRKELEALVRKHGNSANAIRRALGTR